MFHRFFVLLGPLVGVAMIGAAPLDVGRGMSASPSVDVAIAAPSPGYSTVSEATIQPWRSHEIPWQAVAFYQPLPEYSSVSEVGTQPWPPNATPSQAVAFREPPPGYGTVSEVTIQPQGAPAPRRSASTATSSLGNTNPPSSAFPWCATFSCLW